MDQLLGWAHVIGVFGTWFVLYRRSGLAEVKARDGVDWREFLLPNVLFFLLMWGKCLVWEFTLVAWVITGRQESRWTARTEVDGRPARAIVRTAA